MNFFIVLIVAVLPMYITLIHFSRSLCDNLKVWPIPKKYSFSGTQLKICKNFEIIGSGSEILEDAVSRYSSFIKRGYDNENCLKALVIKCDTYAEELEAETDVNYILNVTSKGGMIKSSTIYGAMYGLESFTQLTSNGTLAYSEVLIEDQPNFKHRGVLMDTGRRFWPVETAKMLIDGMSHLKMNVLHMHLSEQARVAVESKKYPGLTKNLVGKHGGFYKQSEIKEIVKYAKYRGIRVIPEIDIPGHSSCFRGLIEDGIQFCNERQYQLFDDPENKTYTIITELMEEIFSLFPSKYVHLGCDETDVVGNCTLENTRNFENKLFKFVYYKLGKRPIAWEEALYTEHSEIPELIVNAWNYHTNNEVRKDGFDAIENQQNAFYIWQADQPYYELWIDINNVTIGENKKQSTGSLFGGEVSMWGDNYCWAYACGEIPGEVPPGAVLYPPEMNEIFHESIMSMVFPRTIIGAGSFWNYRENIDKKSDLLKDYYQEMNIKLRNYGIITCPNDCYCDELTKCDIPYIKNK